jgi:hypothetical protein
MISFFFQERGAGLINGRQMGEFLGAKLNPTEGFDDDICIYVKCVPPDNFPKRSYVNIVDGVGLIPWLARHPECGVISTSVTGTNYLKNRLNREVVFIPEAHCNWDRETRTRSRVTTVGVIGNKKGFDIPLSIAIDRLRAIGLEFKYCDTYTSRQSVVDFYKTVDIQICYRPNVTGVHALLHNPLKLENAGSFGIPTVAYAEENFIAEFGGCFVPVDNEFDLFRLVAELKNDPGLYGGVSRRSAEKSEEYHIENVAEYYRRLS